MASHRHLCQYLLFSTESTFRQANSTHLLESTSTRYFLNCHSNTKSVTPLTSRTNSVWTALSGVIRIYAAYNIHNAVYQLSKGKLLTCRLYDLTIWSFGLALLHFGSEWFYFKTASYGPGVLSPIIVASNCRLLTAVDGSYFSCFQHFPEELLFGLDFVRQSFLYSIIHILFHINSILEFNAILNSGDVSRMRGRGPWGCFEFGAKHNSSEPSIILPMAQDLQAFAHHSNNPTSTHTIPPPPLCSLSFPL